MMKGIIINTEEGRVAISFKNDFVVIEKADIIKEVKKREKGRPAGSENEGKTKYVPYINSKGKKSYRLRTGGEGMTYAERSRNAKRAWETRRRREEAKAKDEKVRQEKGGYIGLVNLGQNPEPMNSEETL